MYDLTTPRKNPALAGTLSERLQRAVTRTNRLQWAHDFSFMAVEHSLTTSETDHAGRLRDRGLSPTEALATILGAR